MAILDTRELQKRGSALAGEHRREGRSLVLLYCGVIAAISLGSNGLHLYLDSHIGETGGLDGLGMRSVLQTIQEVLTYINYFFGPFWSAGFLYAMLGMVRGDAPRLGDMTEGFRRFGRVLTSTLYRLMLALSLGISALMIAMLIFQYSPWGSAVEEAMAPVASDPNLFLSDGSVNLALFPEEAMTMGVYPLAILWLVLSLALYAYISYGFRMSEYLMMERKIGGVASLFLSRRLMRGHKWQMLKLDLRFWWYYALGGLISVVGYLDMIMSLLGLPLPMDATVMFFVTLGANCLLQTGLYLWKKCDVDAAYLLAFEAIAYPEPVKELAEME